MFLFDRRKEGDLNAESGWSEVESKDKGIEKETPLRYVHLPTAIVAAFGAELSVSDRTRLNPRPMCGRRSIFSTLGSTGVNTVDS